MKTNSPRTAAVLIVALGLATATLALPRAAQPQTVNWLSVPIRQAGQKNSTLRCVLRRKPTAAAASVAFSPDGKTLAVTGYREVVLWDIAAAKIAKRLPLAGLVRAVAYAPDKSLFVAGGEHGAAGIVGKIDPATSKLQPLAGPTDVVSALAVSPDGKLLAAGSDDSNVYVYSLPGGKLAKKLTDHSGRVYAARFSRDGKMLLTAASDNSAKVWNVGGEWEMLASHAATESIRDVDFDVTGKDVLMLIDGPSQSEIRARKATVVRRGRGSRTYWTGGIIPQKMALAQKTDRFYLATSSGKIRVYRAKNRKMLKTFPGAAAQTFSMAVSPDGKLLAAGSDEGDVRLFDLEKETLRAVLVQLKPQSDQWAIVTPTGYAASSNPAALSWHKKGTRKKRLPLAGKLLKPELVKSLLAGKKVPRPALP